MSINSRPFIASVIDSIVSGISSYSDIHRVGNIKLAPPYAGDVIKQASDLNRFNHVKIDHKNVFRLSNGDFVTYFKCEGEYYIGISVDSFDNSELESIDEKMEDLMAFRWDFEPCFFMHMVHYLKNHYSVKKGISSYEIIDKLGLTVRENNSAYIGHDVIEVMDIFMTLRVYKIDNDSILLLADRWYLVCYLALNFCSLQSGIMRKELISLANESFEQGKCNLENIYLSLTASHHKYMFIEIYRCLEALYYLPWMIALRDTSGVSHNAFSLAKIVSKSIGWKEKERDSINNLFVLIPESIFSSSNFKDLSFIPTEMKSVALINDSFKTKCSDIIYNVRNQSVHQQDYEDIQPYAITSDDWVIMTEFIYMCVNRLYTDHKQDIHVYQCDFVDII